MDVPPGGRIFLQSNNGAGVQVIQPAAQEFLQNSILRLTGAVAGIVPGGEMGKLPDGISQLPACRVHADEVEAADKHIGLEPAQDIQHTLVGAAAEKILFSILFQQQILLVEISIVHVNAVFPEGLPENAKGKGPLQIIAGAQGDAPGQLQNIGHRDQPGISLQ